MQKNLILVLVAFAMFMEAVDTTVLNTAVPVMAHSFGVNPIDLKLALISYLLSLAIFIPISGWVADKFGTKKVFLCAVGVFTLSSIWCGYSHNLTELVIARITQGLGGSLTMPVGRLIIVRTCERHELINKMSIVVMVAALGMMLGPVMGGLITTHFSWSWIFWVNAPIGLLTILLSLKFLPAMPARSVAPLDKIGFVLFGASLAIFTYGLSAFSESHSTGLECLGLMWIACLLLFLYWWHSKNQAHPIVRVDMLRVRTFRVSISGNLLARLGFGGAPFILPLLFQIGLGFTPELSGFLLAPIALGVLLVKPLSLKILRLFGYKKLLLLNTLLVSLGLCSFTLISPSTPIILIAMLTFIYGFLISLQYTGMNSLAYANIEADNISAATSMMSTIQQLSQSFGVAVAALLLRMLSSTLTITAFHHCFLALGLLTFLSALVFIPLQEKDGHELIDRPL